MCSCNSCDSNKRYDTTAVKCINKVMGKTRRNKHKVGGEKIGEGVQGIAYDTGCAVSGPSLCKTLDKETITQIEIFKLDGNTEKVVDPKSIEDFKEKIAESHDSISKVFKPSGFFSLRSTRTNFLYEIKENLKVLKDYGKISSKRYLTLAGLDGMIGAVITTASNTYHVIFNEKCNPRYDFDVEKFTLDLLKSLEKYDGNHNDIKLDNIVFCNGTYKFIDWGKAGPKNELIAGNSATTSPMKWYIYGGYSSLAKRYFASKIKQEVRSHPEFADTYKNILDELDTALVETSNRTTLMNKYKDSFDVFALGMTILYGIIEHKLDYIKYRILIQRLTSLKDPMNPKQALVFSKKFFKKL